MNENSAGLLMRPPGFKDTPMPAANDDNSLVWLGQQVAQDGRFALNIARRVYTLVTGQEPVAQPVVAESDDHQAQLFAYRAQNRYFQQLAADFAADNFRLNGLVKAVLLGPWYRAASASADLDPTTARALEIAQLGGAEHRAARRQRRRSSRQRRCH